MQNLTVEAHAAMLLENVAMVCFGFDIIGVVRYVEVSNGWSERKVSDKRKGFTISIRPSHGFAPKLIAFN